MTGLVRLVLGIVLGTVLGGLIVFLIEGVSHMIWPPPQGDWTDPEFLKTAFKTVSLEAKLAVLLAWGMGVFCGAIVARLVSGRHRVAGWAVGGILFAMMVFTMMTIPHPIWMMVNSVTVTIIGVIGANRLTRRKLA